MIAGLLLPSIETGEEGSKMHDLFTGLIARDVETQVFKRVLNAQKGSKERMALFNLIFNATGDNFGKLVQRFNEGERILLPILEFCFRSGIHQAYNETASSPVEITLSDGTTKELSGRFLATWEAMDLSLIHI